MNSRIGIFTLIIVLIMSVSPVIAEDWTTLTSGWRPEHIVSAEGDLWAAAEGGLLHVDTRTSLLEVLNTDDGLFSNFLTAIEVDAQTGYLWVGHSNGGIDVLNPKNRRIVYTIRDFYNDQTVDITINDIFIHDDVIFVATNQGLSRVSRFEDEDLWVVLETYRGFGSWSRPTEITDIAVLDGDVFIGSQLGIAHADLNDNLLNVSAWTTVNNQEIDPGATTNGIQFIKELDGVLYVGYYLGKMFSWDGIEFSQFTSTTGVFDILSMADGTLFAGRGNGLYRKTTADANFVRIDDDYTAKFWGVTLLDGAIWSAIDTNTSYFGGIASWDEGEFTYYYPNTPGGDQILSMATSPQGDIWIAARNTRIPGVYRLKDGIWYPYAQANSSDAPWGYSTAINAIDFDPQGGTWIGTWGNSVYYIGDGMTTPDTLVYYHHQNSKLTGVGGGNPDYIVVNGFEPDPEGGIWFSNMLAEDNNTLLYAPEAWLLEDPEERDPDIMVEYGVAEGLNSDDVSKIEMDSRGRLWLAAITDQGTPLVMWDPKGTPTDPSDDEHRHLTSSIGFDFVNDMRMADDGFLWFATSNGLFYIDTRLNLQTDEEDLTGENGGNQVVFTEVFGALGESITALTIDPLNQVWAGTDFGLSVLGRDKFSWIRQYTSNSSGLIDNQITALTLDPRTGDVYIGTNVGISVVSTPYRDFGAELGTIEVAPQPFLIGSGSQNLRFGSSSLVADAEVRFYTPSGILVRTLGFQTASAEGWDGRDDDGEWVASGVYYIVVTDPEGSSQTGKVAVVRE